MRLVSIARSSVALQRPTLALVPFSSGASDTALRLIVTNRGDPASAGYKFQLANSVPSAA